MPCLSLATGGRQRDMPFWDAIYSAAWNTKYRANTALANMVAVFELGSLSGNISMPPLSADMAHRQ